MTTQQDVNEFLATAAAQLGNANGNIYVSRSGVKGEHDGQVYVRLKKKRFVVLDYTIDPSEADIHAAASLPHMEIPSGAGRTPCITKECTKVGVPVKLFDSNPDDSVSLYLRSGLCFECQRNLNEKRRVDRRKRPSGDNVPLLYSIGSPNQKKFKLHGSSDVVELSRDAIIVNGSMKNVKMAADGHSTSDLASDVQDYLREASFETERLFQVAGNPHTAPVDPLADIQGMYEKAFTNLNKAIFLLTQWKSAWDVGTLAASTGDNGHATMASLLLAADKDQQQQKGDEGHHDDMDPHLHLGQDDHHHHVVDHQDDHPDVHHVDAGFMEV